MALSDQPYRENEALRERLSRLGAASRRINESLDLVTFSGRCEQTVAGFPQCCGASPRLKLQREPDLKGS